MIDQVRRRLSLALGGAALGAAWGAAAPALAEDAQSEDRQSEDPRSEDTRSEDTLAQRVDAQMQKLLASYPIPGAVIAVARHGQLVYQRGYGMAVTESSTPATPQTRFRIGSISKPVTAVALLKLFEDELPQALSRKVFGPDGLLPDGAYPEFAKPLDTRALKITLGQLLRHTAGWGVSDYDPQSDLVAIARAMNVAAPASARAVTAYMLTQRLLEAEPGTEYHYSHFGYTLLGRIIEHKSGKPFEQAVRELVWQPAGVDGAAIGADKRIARLANEAVYYDDARWPAVADQDGSGATGPASYAAYHLASMDAASGWVATAADLVRMTDAALGQGSGPALLKPATVALMAERDPHMLDNAYGLGWVVTRMRGVRILSHSGAMSTGSYGYLQSRADGWTWAVLMNRLPVAYPPEQAVSDLRDFQVQVQRGLMAAIINQPDPVELPPAA